MIGVVPRFRTLNRVVTIAVPAIPIVTLGRPGYFVLRIRGGPAHRNHVASADFSAALLGGDLRLAVAGDDYRVAVRSHLNAEAAILMGGMDGDVRRINLRLGLATLKNDVGSDTLFQLHLNLIFRKGGDVRL
jgi:hypothetical protein